MTNILAKIVAAKRTEIAQRSAADSFEDLRARARDVERPRNFFRAVTKPPMDKVTNVIAEVKRASPSAGIIRDDFDPVAIATQYERAGVDAISVLTDEKFFHGSLDHLKAVKAAVSLPILRKDFVIDAWQVLESAVAGADAILLIAECLETNEMIDLQILATELHMTSLIEVHDFENLMRVRDSVVGFPHKSYSLLGINNRNLETFDVDLGNTLRMAEFVDNRDVLVSESGIQTRRDVDKLVDAGVRACLIGERLMRSENPSHCVRELFR